MIINPKMFALMMNIIKDQLPSFPPTGPGSSMSIKLIQIDWGRVKGSSWVDSIQKPIIIQNRRK